MSIRLSLRCFVAALAAGLALSFTPVAPAAADEDPVVRAPRYRVAPPRLRAPLRHVHHVRTVVRTRYVPVPVAYTTTCGGCVRAVAAPRYYVRQYYVPRHYGPRYHAGCGCAVTVALPYYWAVRTARYRYAYGY
jgi:hypothetical protein